jgi:hypothetical protein
MSARPTDDNDRHWREALVEVEHARQAYVEHLKASDDETAEIDRLWLRLWRAERRRDELMKDD